MSDRMELHGTRWISFHSLLMHYYKFVIMILMIATQMGAIASDMRIIYSMLMDLLLLPFVSRITFLRFSVSMDGIVIIFALNSAKKILRHLGYTECWN